MSKKIAVLGGGAMGTACSVILAEQAEQDVRLWIREPEIAKATRDQGENKAMLAGVAVPKSITVTSDISEAVDGIDYLVLAIPSAFLRGCLTDNKDQLASSCPIVSTIKGMETSTHSRPSEIITSVLPDRHVGIMSGPSHAEEFANRLPASVVAASDNAQLALDIQTMFSTDRFRVYTNDDMVGVELSGALKNVIAIAAGTCEGLKLGDNAISALLTRSLVEMVSFGEHFGAKQKTFYGLSGIGDLMTTCFSPHGRNRQVGLLLGQGKSLQEIYEIMKAFAEGIQTAKAITELADKHQIEMPICRQVYEVLFEDKSVIEAMNSLLQRPLQAE